MTADKQSTSTHIILTNINWQVTNKKKIILPQTFSVGSWNLQVQNTKKSKS